MVKMEKNASIIILIYIFLIFYNVISNRIPYGNYLDEIICLVSFLLYLIVIFRRGSYRLNKNSLKMLLSCVLMAMLGIISNLVFGYVDSFNIILRDFVGIYKFFMTYVAFDCFLRKENFCAKRCVIAITKVFIVIIFFLAVISLFVDIGMGDSVRFGIRSYKFIFSFYNVLVFNEVIFIAVLLTEKKRNTFYYIMAFITLTLTLRTKSLVVILMAVLFKQIGVKKLVSIIKGNFINKLKYIIPTIILVWILSKDKIMQYISWGKYNSIRIGAIVTSFEILRDHFPLGSGFGTYGTNLSYDTNSIIYSIYNQINYKLMMDPEYGFATMSDTFWPAIIAQFGIIGLILWMITFYQFFRMILKKKYVCNENKISCIFIIMYMIFVTFSEAIFLNDTGMISAVLIAIILNLSNKECKKYDT